MVVRKLIKQKPRRGKFSGKNFKKREVLINAEEEARIEAKTLGLKYTPPVGGKKKKKKPKCSRWLFPGAHYPGKPAPPRKNARGSDSESLDNDVDRRVADVDASEMDKGVQERKGTGRLRYFEQMVGPERTQGGELDSVTFSRAKKREKEEIRGKKRREKEEKRETERREKEERRAEKRAKRESRNGVAAPGNADLSGSAAELASNAAETSNGVGVKASGGVKASSGGKPSAGVKAYAEVKASGVAEVSNAAADSSSEDEEEAKRQAAISSVVVEGTHIMGAAAATATFRHKRKAKRGLQSTLASKERRRLRKMGLQPDGEEGSESENEGEEEGGEDGEGRGGEDKGKDLKLKHYQIRAQDMLHQHLDKLLEMTVAAAEKGVGEGEGGEGGAEDAVNGNVDGSGRDDGETKAVRKRKEKMGKKEGKREEKGVKKTEGVGMEGREGKRRKKGERRMQAKQAKIQVPESGGIALFRKGPVVSLQ